MSHVSAPRIAPADVHALVEEALRTGMVLGDLISDLLDSLPDDAFPGEEPARVLLEMVAGSAHPAAAAAGPRAVRETTALLAAITDRVLADLHAAMELAGEREASEGDA